MGALSRSFLLHLPAHFYSLPQPPIMLVLGWAPTPRENLAPQTPRTEHFTRLSAFDCLAWVRPNPMKSKAQLSLQDVLMPRTFASRTSSSRILIIFLQESKQYSEKVNSFYLFIFLFRLIFFFFNELLKTII